MFSDIFSQLIIHPLFKPLVDTFALLIALLTALAAIRSSRAASETNEIKLLPILNIYFKETASSSYRFYIKNLGEGPAFDIQISPWNVILTDLKQIWRLEMSLEKTNLIESKAEVLVSYNSTINNRHVDVSDIMAAHLHPETSSKLPRVKLNIIFTNAVRHRYFTIVELGKGGVKINTPSTRLDWQSKIIFMLNDLFNFLKRLWYISMWKFKKQRSALLNKF